MEIRALAEAVLLSADLDAKLSAAAETWTDADPGPAVRHALPARAENLQFAARRAAPAMPKFGALIDPAKRALAHHILANHELQALEVMAWVLLAFPDAPPEFRRGMVEIMRDEQRHTRMHVERAERLGLHFGDRPVNCYIWVKAQAFRAPLEYVCGLPLMFEGRNLDHTLEFADAFDRASDARSAALMRTIHRDEIRHVAFGYEWLTKLKPPHLTEWEAFSQNLHWPLRPAKARGTQYQREARLAAGMSPEFVDRLAACELDDDESSGTTG
jgi:uncharacterized ferritin-like protein (DUF455 family)